MSPISILNAVPKRTLTLINSAPFEYLRIKRLTRLRR